MTHSRLRIFFGSSGVCSLYCLSHTHWVITAIDAVALDITATWSYWQLWTYRGERERDREREREREERTLLSFVSMAGSDRHLWASRSSVPPLLSVREVTSGTWRVGSPGVCFTPGSLCKSERVGGQQKLTMGTKHALLRSCFGEVYVIKNHSAFTFHIGWHWK